MGGCYESSYSRSSVSYEPQWKTDMQSSMKKFFTRHDIADLVVAYRSFFESNTSGFIKVLLDHCAVKEAPKEFPDIEYEVKFCITPRAGNANRNEPTIEQYLQAFQFPAGSSARFLKDPVDSVAEGTNHFYGKDGKERLVVIEKGGKRYLKEKSQPLPLTTDIPYQEIVMKRTEKRYEATMDEILKKNSRSAARRRDVSGKPSQGKRRRVHPRHVRRTYLFFHCYPRASR